MLSAWVWFYILAVSLITDLISRYIVVVLPFLVLHIALEVCALASMVRDPPISLGVGPFCCAPYC